MKYRYLLGFPALIALKFIPIDNNGLSKTTLSFTDPANNRYQSSATAAGCFWLNSYGDTVCRCAVPTDLPAGHYTIHTYASDGSRTVAILDLSQPFAAPGNQPDRAIAVHPIRPIETSSEKAFQPTRAEDGYPVYSCGEQVRVPNTSPGCPQESIW